MPSYKRPGTFVEESLSLQQATNGSTSTSLAAFVGSNPRGPVTPTFVSSWSDYTSQFGGFTENKSALTYAVFSYFGNGGRGAYVVRAAHSDAAAATRTLTDRAGGTPASTLKVDALNPGVWGNTVYIDIADTGVTGRFDLVVRFGGTSDANIVERWTDLSMLDTDSRYVVSIVNAVNGQGSRYIKVTDLVSATAAPGDTPSAQISTALASGSDGSTVAQADYIGSSSAAVNQLDIVDNPLVLNLPAVTDAATLGAVINYAATRGDVFVVVDPQAGRTAAQAVTDTAAVAAAANAASLSYAATYYPQIYVNDPATTASGPTKLIPAGGAIVGQFAANDASRGVWRAPGGIGAQIQGAVAIERRLTPADLDALNSATYPVNAIRFVPGGGICTMGVRTLKLGAIDKYVSARRTLIYLKAALRDVTAYAQFQPNDGLLWAGLRAQVSGLLTGFWQQGGLTGSTPDQAFYVKCDSSTNPPSAIANGEVHMEIGVALEYPAEFIVIKLGQFEGGAAVVAES